MAEQDLNLADVEAVFKPARGALVPKVVPMKVNLLPAILHTPWRFMWNQSHTVWLVLLHLEHASLSLKSMPDRGRIRAVVRGGGS